MLPYQYGAVDGLLRSKTCLAVLGQGLGVQILDRNASAEIPSSNHLEESPRCNEVMVPEIVVGNWAKEKQR